MSALITSRRSTGSSLSLNPGSKRGAQASPFVGFVPTLQIKKLQPRCPVRSSWQVSGGGAATHPKLFTKITEAGVCPPPHSGPSSLGSLPTQCTWHLQLLKAPLLHGEWLGQPGLIRWWLGLLRGRCGDQRGWQDVQVPGHLGRPGHLSTLQGRKTSPEELQGADWRAG